MTSDRIAVFLRQPEEVGKPFTTVLILCPSRLAPYQLPLAEVLPRSGW
jgi:hypothetical protein